jgi:hypothetical protein
MRCGMDGTRRILIGSAAISSTCGSPALICALAARTRAARVSTLRRPNSAWGTKAERLAEDARFAAETERKEAAGMAEKGRDRVAFGKVESKDSSGVAGSLNSCVSVIPAPFWGRVRGPAEAPRTIDPGARAELLFVCLA